jgi:hypothetical protein
MNIAKPLVWFLPGALLIAALPAAAQGGCDLPGLGHQLKDAPTVQRLEDAWSLAYLKGDTEFEKCLLVPEFTEIVRSGELKTLEDELRMAANNRGKNLPVPSMPRATILIHDNVAVAYGESLLTSGVNSKRTRYADFYVWKNGRWHVFFAQQTAVEGKP